MKDLIITNDGRTIEIEINESLINRIKYRRKNKFNKNVKLSKDRYYFIFDIACKLLVAAGIFNFPLDVFQLTKFCGVAVSTFQNNIELIRKLGITKNDEAVYIPLSVSTGIILYNDDITTRQRVRFSILHELAHHILQNFYLDYDVQEKEANMLAARLLMPMSIINACNVCTPHELAYLFDASYEASEIRFNEYLEKIKCNKFGKLDSERRLIEGCKDFIDAYNTNAKSLNYANLNTKEISTVKNFVLNKYKQQN